MTKDRALQLALDALNKLWAIIDDIDTFGDMAKGDDALFRGLVERRQRDRFAETGIETDGLEITGGAITAIKKALAEPEPTVPSDNSNSHQSCNPHPDAPHGFDRNSSHTEDRYVCECESWVEPNQEPNECDNAPALKPVAISNTNKEAAKDVLNEAITEEPDTVIALCFWQDRGQFKIKTSRVQNRLTLIGALTEALHKVVNDGYAE